VPRESLDAPENLPKQARRQVAVVDRGGGGSKAASKGSRAGPSANCRIPATAMKTGHRATPPRYDKLERVVVPLFYRERERFIDVMRHAIALNGSFFNTHRMVLQYVTKAYSR
jgi:hypothetical protein